MFTFTKAAQLTACALALITPALACVQYSADYDVDSTIINAGLTDNGVQTCSLTNFQQGIDTADNDIAYLGCIGGYGAYMDLGSGVVTYWTPGFAGTFSTLFSQDGTLASYAGTAYGC